MSDPILDLLAAPPSPSLSVDEDAVYAGGRRRLRRRTLRRIGFGLGAAVAATAVAFAAVGTGVGNETLPAGPSPTTSTQRVSAPLFDGSYSVEVRPDASADHPNVIFYRGYGASRQELSGSDVDPSVISMGTGTGADGVMLGTAPASAANFLTLLKGGAAGYSTDEQLLLGTDYQAVALRFENPADTAKYVGTVWMNDKGDGVVRTAMGLELPSTKLADRDTFWVDRENAYMGVFLADGNGGSTRPLSGAGSTTTGYGTKHDVAGWMWHSVTLLPAGARDVTYEWADADYRSTVFTQTLPRSGEVVAFSDATAPASSQGPRVTSVTWTDKAGTRHTEAVP